MKRRRLFLILAAGLAVVWTAWLGYQALTTADPVVVSRPQIMVAPVVVEATIEEDRANPRTASIVRIYRGHDVLGLPPEADAPKNLRIKVRGVEEVSAGSFIMALRETENPGEFAVVPLPRSPGFASGGRQAPVYPATESTRLQAREALRQFQKALGQ